MESHPKSLLTSLLKMRNNEVMTDVTLKLPDATTIPCHKLILIAASPFFEAMFNSGLKESLEQEVELKFSEADNIRMVVDFIYSNEIEITEDNVNTLIDASEFLMLKGLKFSCEEFLTEMLNTSNCGQFCQLGRKYHMKNLIASAVDFIVLHFAEIVESSDFYKISEEDIIEVISDDRLNVKNEGVVFEAVVRWVEADLEARKEVFSRNIAPRIRFPLCDQQSLGPVVSCHPLMWNPECAELLKEAHSSQFHCGTHPVQNPRTTQRNNGQRLVRLYNGEDGTVCVDHTVSIDGESVKWEHYSTKLISEIKEVMTSPEKLFWITKTKELFALDLKTRNISTHFWKEPKPNSSLILIKDKIFSLFVDAYRWSKHVESLQWNVSNNEWSTETSLDDRSVTSSASPVVINVLNNVYIFGWRSGADVMVFDSVSKTLLGCAPMPATCTPCSALALKGNIFVVGRTEKVCFRYDPVTNAWTTLSSPTTTSANSKATVWKGKIILYEANEAEVYDPGLDRWTLKTGLFDEDTKEYETKIMCSMSF